MYLHLLTRGELSGFERIAEHLLCVDGECTGQEEDALRQLLHQLGLEERDRTRTPELDPRNLIQSYKSRIISLIELTGLAYVDSDFCQAEQDFLKALTSYWEIEPDVLDQITQDVAILANINEELVRLMDEEV